MKTRYLVVALTMAAALMAQGPGRARRKSGTTPADPVAREVQMLTNYFVLSASQQTAVANILTPNVPALQALQATLKTQRATLVADIKANSTGVGTDVSALHATEVQIDTIRATEAGAIYALLTPDQQAKVNASGLGPLYGGGGPGMGFGRRGGPPPAQ